MKRRKTALFLHGFLGQPDSWNPVLQGIVSLPNWDVQLFNLWDDLPILEFGSIPEWLDVLADRFRPISPIIVCGYSLGARLAMALTCRHPDLIERLVVVSGHPGLLSKSERSARLQDDRRWGQIFTQEPWREAIKQWNQREVFAGHEIQPAAGSFSPAKLQACLEIFSLGKQLNLRPCLQELEIPVLWVVGENDSKFVQLAREEWIDNPSIDLRIIPDCGHRVLHEKPGELAALLDGFFTMDRSTRGDA